MPEGTWFFVGTKQPGDRGSTVVERGRLVVWNATSSTEVQRVVDQVRSNSNDLETIGVIHYAVDTSQGCEDWTLYGEVRNGSGNPVAGARPASVRALLQGYWGDVHLVTR
jgi:hypothetical protein